MAEADGTSEDVKILTGDYKRAIWHLSIPIAVALAIQHINILVDTFWVAGLGADPMASISIVYPVFATVMGIGSGLGIGASAAIARSIGQNNRKEAGRKAGQSLLLSVLVSVALTPILLITMEPSIILFGGSDILGLCKDYATPLYLATFVIILNAIITGIIRGEGAAKRSMYIQLLSAAVNIIMDPILIYGLGMGVAGAAWATVIAFGSSIILAFYWYFIKKDMYLKIGRKEVKYSPKEMKGVLKVGLPEATELSVMNIFNVFLNLSVIMVAGTVGVAMYSTGWRVVYLLMIPAQAVGGAIVSICSAQYGAEQYGKIRKTYYYGVRKTVETLIVLAIILFITADLASAAFTYEGELAAKRDEMTYIIRVFCIMVPVMSLIFTGSSLLQSLENANIALASSFMRNLMLAILFAVAAYLIGTPHSLWWSLTLGEIVGGLLMLGLALWRLGLFERSKGISRKL
ncbi:MAG: MATE family efflux transporter [Methanomassiliicoccaceae archaeon]|nr:MATE family efflux transporter [Methanomassiliicoccaceae archaeon]